MKRKRYDTPSFEDVVPILVEQESLYFNDFIAIRRMMVTTKRNHQLFSPLFWRKFKIDLPTSSKYISVHSRTQKCLVLIKLDPDKPRHVRYDGTSHRGHKLQR
jgi:hypothetical protein